eukprot:1790914-Prymnesium_polylepis.1
MHLAALAEQEQPRRGPRVEVRSGRSVHATKAARIGRERVAREDGLKAAREVGDAKLRASLQAAAARPRLENLYGVAAFANVGERRPHRKALASAPRPVVVGASLRPFGSGHRHGAAASPKGHESASGHSGHCAHAPSIEHAEREDDQ